jgi:hypothetical protein
LCSTQRGAARDLRKGPGPQFHPDRQRTRHRATIPVAAEVSNCADRASRPAPSQAWHTLPPQPGSRGRMFAGLLSSTPGPPPECEEPIAGAIAVSRAASLVVTEGNYLLVRDEPWAGVGLLLDECWYADLDEATRLRWLIQRHVDFGKTQEAAEAQRHLRAGLPGLLLWGFGPGAARIARWMRSPPGSTGGR